jgi:hypothetical protein
MRHTEEGRWLLFKSSLRFGAAAAAALNGWLEQTSRVNAADAGVEIGIIQAQ